MTQGRFVIPFSQLRMTDVDIVGGKNASLGELLSQLTEAALEYLTALQRRLKLQSLFKRRRS